MNAAHDVGSLHQAFNSLMNVAETLFETDDCLAICRKPEMTRFNNSRMNWPNRYLM